MFSHVNNIEEIRDCFFNYSITIEQIDAIQSFAFKATSSENELRYCFNKKVNEEQLINYLKETCISYIESYYSLKITTVENESLLHFKKSPYTQEENNDDIQIKLLSMDMAKVGSLLKGLIDKFNDYNEKNYIRDISKTDGSNHHIKFIRPAEECFLKNKFIYLEVSSHAPDVTTVIENVKSKDNKDVRDFIESMGKIQERENNKSTEKNDATKDLELICNALFLTLKYKDEECLKELPGSIRVMLESCVQG